MNAIDLEQLEERAYTSRWDDGLLDLFIGVGLLLVGALWLIPDVAGLGGIAPVLLIPFWPLARKWVTEPRAGYVEFGSSRRVKERRGLRSLLFLGTGAFLLGVAAYFVGRGEGMMTEAWVRLAVPALPGVLVGIGGMLAGLVFGVDRLMSYGLVVMALAAVFTYFGAEPGTYLFTAGAILATLGGVRLWRFLRSNPIPEAGSP